VRVCTCIPFVVVITYYYAYGRAYVCVCVCVWVIIITIIIIIYYSRILWRAYCTRSCVLYACARGALSVYCTPLGRGPTHGIQSDRDRRRRRRRQQHSVCTHILSSLIGGGQRVPILNIRSCSSLLSATHNPLQYNTITRRSFLLLFVTAIVFCPSVRLQRVSACAVCTVHSTSPRNNSNNNMKILEEIIMLQSPCM